MDWQVLLSDADRERPATADDAVDTLVAGNARFSGRDDRPRDLLPPSGDDPLVKQAPVCVLLGCADARVPAELLFDTGPNRLFVVRVAGNVLGDECLGSVEYAIASFPDTVKLVLVLGHSACGAVAAAVDSYLKPREFIELMSSRSLRAVVNHISAAVRSAALILEHVYGPEVAGHPGYKAALAELSVPVNAAVTALQLLNELDPPADAPYRVVWSQFDIASGEVGLPGLGDPRLRPAPRTADDLITACREIAAGPAVRRHLPTG